MALMAWMEVLAVAKLADDLINAIRKEAFEDGRVAGISEAMDALGSLLKRKAPEAGAPSRAAITTFANTTATQTAMPRGASLVVVEEIMREIAPEAVTAKQLIAIAKQRKVRLSETSAGRSVRQLAEMGVVHQVPYTKTWRYGTP